jgi:hypothetical protein
MKTIHVSLAFAGKPDAGLDDFTQNVITKFGGGPLAAGSPVTVADLTTARTNFSASVAKSIGGSRADTAAKEMSRKALVNLERQIALYVQGNANAASYPTVVLNAGFQIASDNHAQSPLPKAVIGNIVNEASTELVLRLQAIPNAKAYEVRISTGTNPAVDAGTFTQARRIVLQNLTPGTTYTVSARGVGGSTGYGDWSDPVSHMAM